MRKLTPPLSLPRRSLRGARLRPWKVFFVYTQLQRQASLQRQGGAR